MRIHYAGKLTIYSGRGVTKYGGNAPVCGSQGVAQLLDPPGVTCKRCLRLLQKARDNGRIGDA